MRERLFILIFLFISISNAFEYGGQKYLAKDEEGEQSNDDLADTEVRSIIAAIVDAVLDGDRRKRSEIKDGRKTKKFRGIRSRGDESDNTSTGTSGSNNGKNTKKLSSSLHTKNTVPSPRNATIIEADIDDSLKVLNLEVKKKSDVVASKVITEELLDPRNTNHPLHPMNYSTAAQVTPAIDLPSLNVKKMIGDLKYAKGSVLNLTTELERDNTDMNAASRRTAGASGSGESDTGAVEHFGVAEDSMVSETSGSADDDVKTAKQNVPEDPGLVRTSATLSKNSNITSDSTQKTAESSNDGDVAGSAEVSGSGDVSSDASKKGNVVDNSGKQNYMKKDALLIRSPVPPVSVHTTPEEDDGSGPSDERRRDEITTTAYSQIGDAERTVRPATFITYRDPEMAGDHLSYYKSNVLNVNHFGMSETENNEPRANVRRKEIIADVDSSGSGGDGTAEDAASASGGGDVDFTSGGDQVSGSGINSVARSKVESADVEHDVVGDIDKRETLSDSEVSGSAETDNVSKKEELPLPPKGSEKVKSVGSQALDESHSGETSGVSESGEFDTTNGFSASGEPEADNYGDIGSDYKAYNRRNSARRRGIDDGNILDEHSQSPLTRYSIPRGQPVMYYKESTPDDVLNIPNTREMGSTKATDIEVNNLKSDDPLTIVSASDDTAASGSNEVKGAIEAPLASNNTANIPSIGKSALATENKRDHENSTKNDSWKSLSDTIKSIGFTNKSHKLLSPDKNGFKNGTLPINMKEDNKTFHKQFLENKSDLNKLKKELKNVSPKTKARSKNKKMTSHSGDTDAGSGSEKAKETQDGKDDEDDIGENTAEYGIASQLKKDEGAGGKKISDADKNHVPIDDNNEKSIANIEEELDDDIGDVNKKHINESNAHGEDDKTDIDDKGSDYIKEAVSSGTGSDADTNTEAPLSNRITKDSDRHDSDQHGGDIAHHPGNKTSKIEKSKTHDMPFTQSQLKNVSLHLSPYGKTDVNKGENAKEDKEDKKKATHNKKGPLDAGKAHIDLVKTKNDEGAITTTEFYHNKTGLYETEKSYSDLDLLRNHTLFASNNGTKNNQTLYSYLHTNRWYDESSIGNNGPLSESPYSYLDQSEGSNATGDAIIKNITLSKNYYEEDNSTLEEQGVGNETSNNETQVEQVLGETSSIVGQSQQTGDGAGNANGNTNGSQDASLNSNANGNQNGSANSSIHTWSTTYIPSTDFNPNNIAWPGMDNTNSDGGQGATNFNTNTNGVQVDQGAYNTNTNGVGQTGVGGNVNANNGVDNINSNAIENGNNNGNNNSNSNVNENNNNSNGDGNTKDDGSEENREEIGDQSANYSTNGNIDQTASLTYDAKAGLSNDTDNTTSLSDESSESSSPARDENSNGTNSDSISSYQNVVGSSNDSANDTDDVDESENTTDVKNTDFSYLHNNPRPNATDPTVIIHKILSQNDSNDNDRYLSGNETDNESLHGNGTDSAGGANATGDQIDNTTLLLDDSTNQNDLNNATGGNNDTMQIKTEPNIQPLAQLNGQSNAKHKAQPVANLTKLNKQRYHSSNSSTINRFRPLSRASNNFLVDQKPIGLKNSEQVSVSPDDNTKTDKSADDKVNVKVFSSGVTNVYVDHKGNVDVRRVDKRNSTASKNKMKVAQKGARNANENDGDKPFDNNGLVGPDSGNELYGFTLDNQTKEAGAKNEKENLNLNINRFENAKIGKSAEDLENDTNVYIDSKAFTKNSTHNAPNVHNIARNISHPINFKPVTTTFETIIKPQKLVHGIKGNYTNNKMSNYKNNVKPMAFKGTKSKNFLDLFIKAGARNATGQITRNRTAPVTFSKSPQVTSRFNEKPSSNNNKNVSARNISASDVSRSALTIVEDLVDIINSTHGKNKKNGSNSERMAKQKISRYIKSHGLMNGKNGANSIFTRKVIDMASATLRQMEKQDAADRGAITQRYQLQRNKKTGKGSVRVYSPVSLVKREAYEQTPSSQEDEDDTDEDEVQERNEVPIGAAQPRHVDEQFDGSNRLVKKSSVIPPDYDEELESDELPGQDSTQGQLLSSMKERDMELKSRQVPQQAYVVEPKSEPVIVEEIDPSNVEAIKKSEVPDEYYTSQSMTYKKSQIPSEYVPEVVEPPSLVGVRKGDIPPEQLPEDVSPEAEHLEAMKKGQISSEYIPEAVESEAMEPRRKDIIQPEYVRNEQDYGPSSEHRAPRKHSRAHIPPNRREHKVKLQELAADSEAVDGDTAETNDNNRPQYIEKRDEILTDDHEDDNGEESKIVNGNDDDGTAIDNPSDGPIIKTDVADTPSGLRSNILNMLSSSETTLSSSSSPSTELGRDADKRNPTTLASGDDNQSDSESGSAEAITAVTSGEDAGSAEASDENSPSVNTKRDSIAQPVPVMIESENSETTEVSRRNDVENEHEDIENGEKSSDTGSPDLSGSGEDNGSTTEPPSKVVNYGNKDKETEDHPNDARESVVKKLVNEMAHAAAGSVKEGAHVVVKKSNILEPVVSSEKVKRSPLNEEDIVTYSDDKDIHTALKMLVNSLITKGPDVDPPSEHLLRVKRMETEEKLENDILARTSIPRNSSLSEDAKAKIVTGVRDFEGLGEELSQSDFLTPYKHDVIASKLEGDLVKNLMLDKEQSAKIYKEEDDLLKATEMEYIKDKIDREFGSDDGASRSDKINAIKRTIKSLPLSKEDSEDLTKSIQEANWLGVKSDATRSKKSKLKHWHA